MMAGRMTVDDYMKLPEGTLAELIDGEILHVSPSPKRLHQRRLFALAAALRNEIEHRRLGVVDIAPLDVHLPSGDIVQPDIIVVKPGREDLLGDWITGAPDLLVEILSPHNADHDRDTKRTLYERNGVREYWIADGDAKTIEVLTLNGDRYDVHAVCRPGESIRSPLFPDLGVGVGDVLA